MQSATSSLYHGQTVIRRLDRYLFQELFSPFLLGIAFLTFLIFLYQLLRLTEWVLDKGIRLRTVWDIFVTLLPSFFLLTIPMATAFAAILAFNRLSFDNEITALYASGISFVRIARPVFVFSIAAAFLTLLMGGLSNSWETLSVRSMAVQMLKERIGVGLNAGQFTEILPGLILYAERMPTPTKMEHLFLYDGRSSKAPHVIAAQTGFLLNNREEGWVGLQLSNGMLRADNREDNTLMTFRSYTIKMPLPPSLAPSVRGDPSMGERTARRSALTVHKKYSLAYASFLFSFLGIPFGLFSGKRGRLGAFGAGIGLLLLYYLLNLAGDSFVFIQGVPALAAWLPHIVLTPLTVFLVARYAHKVPSRAGA